MELELKPLLNERGYLTIENRNKYLQSKGAVRLDEKGNISSVIYTGTYESPHFTYRKLDEDIDEALKNIRNKKVGTMGVKKDDNKQQDDKEINPNEIPF